eukprot:TRINITY_DN43543_c0_g1_i2.p3 TRINITY_DN43543_c0_g1~~TRINITY_DN43543_c0_g1_i2.p3  ORF type:complete len:101 (-),score=30.50 TRINITY_DN43543_c0_g1_i2:523-825(-)
MYDVIYGGGYKYMFMVVEDELEWFFFFFFKQKTAYEMLRSLVGSEMCIRDSLQGPLAVAVLGCSLLQTHCSSMAETTTHTLPAVNSIGSASSRALGQGFH